MFTRQRERQSVMAGMLLTYLVLLFFAAGCSQNPSSSPAELDPPDKVLMLGDAAVLPEGQPLGTNACIDFKLLWCLIFPPFCWEEPFPQPEYAWGGHDFTPDPEEVPAMAAFHNACLSAWRFSERSADGLMRTFEAEAVQAGLDHHLDDKSRKEASQIFTSLMKGEVSPDMVPGPNTVRKLFVYRPLPGPFPQPEPMFSMLEALEDGISQQEVKDWQSFAQSLRQADPKEYWAASMMAASVTWWHDFSEDVGEDCSWGVFADLAAVQVCPDPNVVAIASLAGALVDFYEHFWPSEKD